MRPRFMFLALALLAAGCGARKLSVGPEFRLAPAKQGNQRGPQVCGLGESIYLVLWQEGWMGAEGGGAIRGCFVHRGRRQQCSPSDSLAKNGICEAPAADFAPESGKLLVVWQELVGGKQYDIRACLQGVIFPEESPVLEPLEWAKSFTLAASPHNEVLPSVASNGKGFLVAWAEYSPEAGSYAPVCARVSNEGKLLDAEPIRLSKSGAAPKAVYNGRDYVVVYDKRDSVWARRVSVDGRLLDTEALKPSGLMGNAPAAASDGRDAVVVAARVPKPNAWGWHGPAAITAGRVTRGGSLPERELNKKMDYVALASAGAPNVLDRADWKGREGWPASWRGDFPGTTNNTWPTTPMAVASDGREYVAVWTRARLGAHDPCVFADLDLYAARVSRRARLASEPVPAADAPGTQTRPAIASAKRGEWLLVYESVAPGGAITVRGRLLRVK